MVTFAQIRTVLPQYITLHTTANSDERGRSCKYDRGLKTMTILHDELELHWLDVPVRIEYKLGVMVYRWLTGRLGTSLITSSQPLMLLLDVSLPYKLRNSDSFDSFKRFLKTILFRRYLSERRTRGFLTRCAI